MNTVPPIIFKSYKNYSKNTTDAQNPGKTTTLLPVSIANQPQSNNNISFSGIGSIFREVHSINKLRHTFSSLSIDINELKESLKPITQSKSILNVLWEEPKMFPAPDPPRTNATSVLCNIESVKLVTEKLKDLGVQDPLNEILSRANLSAFSFFPKPFLKFMESLLNENKGLLTETSVKRLNDDVKSLVEGAQEFDILDEGTCKLLTQSAQKVTQKITG